MRLLIVAMVLAVATGAAHAECGTASWYDSGGRTASGEKLSSKKKTAAHRRLPFGTVLRVSDVQTGRSVDVRVNDRGPFIRGRVIDLSRAAAVELGMISRGHSRVCFSVR
jgi:rare lipoprotein A